MRDVSNCNSEALLMACFLHPAINNQSRSSLQCENLSIMLTGTMSNDPSEAFSTNTNLAEVLTLIYDAICDNNLTHHLMIHQIHFRVWNVQHTTRISEEMESEMTTIDD